MKKIIRIKGGLGNQMFQYTYGRKLSIVDKQKVIFDISSFENQSPKDAPRTFVLNKFALDPEVEFKNLKQNYIFKILSKMISKITGNYHYYQSATYFRGAENQILKEFTLKPEHQSQNFSKLALEISSINSLSLHIRRGDYVLDKKTHTYYGAMDINYYTEGIKIIQEKNLIDHIYIFTDDPEQVKKNFKFEDQCVFISDCNLKDYEELILMSKCKHNIIANSTFSWWGAWLNQNPNKIVIAPKQWTAKKTADELDILPKDWIQI